LQYSIASVTALFLAAKKEKFSPTLAASGVVVLLPSLQTPQLLLDARRKPDAAFLLRLRRRHQ
jgi:hypothetical protein